MSEPTSKVELISPKFERPWRLGLLRTFSTPRWPAWPARMLYAVVDQQLRVGGGAMWVAPPANWPTDERASRPQMLNESGFVQIALSPGEAVEMLNELFATDRIYGHPGHFDRQGMERLAPDLLLSRATGKPVTWAVKSPSDRFGSDLKLQLHDRVWLHLRLPSLGGIRNIDHLIHKATVYASAVAALDLCQARLASRGLLVSAT